MPRTARIAPWGDDFSCAQPRECGGADFRQAGILRRLRASDEGNTGKEADANSGLSDNAQPLASCALAPARRRVGLVHATTHDYTRAALASASKDGRLRASLPGNLQIFSHRSRRAFAGSAVLCGAQRLASGLGRARGRLALVEPMALAAPGRDGGHAAVDGLACGPPATMVASSESASAEVGNGGPANGGRARSSLWKRNLAGNDCQEVGTRIHLSTTRQTKETQIIGLIPFFPLLAAKIKPLKHGRHAKYPPYAFTEHGAIMAANVLNSPEAVAMSVYVVRAFVQMRERLAANAAILKRLAEIDKTLLEHDQTLRIVWQKLQPLLEPPPELPRRRIGFQPENMA